jgi:plastocyanin
MRKLLPIVLVAVALIPIGVLRAGATSANRAIRRVQIPEADRFLPFAITIHVGDAVKWSNGDEDDHAVVSIDRFNTAGHKGTDQVIPVDGTFMLRFNRPGVFVYYCKFHAQLDAYSQPIAPGPEGGEPGTPMSGVVTVIGG